MNIRKVDGYQTKNRILSDCDMKAIGIFKTSEQIDYYFKNYGYIYIGPYDLDNDLIVVKDVNKELDVITCNYDNYKVINYKTNEVIEQTKNYIKNNEVSITSINYHIKVINGIYILKCISDQSSIIEASWMSYISENLICYEKYNIYYIFDTKTNISYPLIKNCKSIYNGKNTNNFVDMRSIYVHESSEITNWYQLNKVNIDAIISKYPYGEIRNGEFWLLKGTKHYGIEISDTNIKKTLWYSDESDRNNVYTEIYELIFSVFDEHAMPAKINVKRNDI